MEESYGRINLSIELEWNMGVIIEIENCLIYIL